MTIHSTAQSIAILSPTLREIRTSSESFVNMGIRLLETFSPKSVSPTIESHSVLNQRSPSPAVSINSHSMILCSCEDDHSIDYGLHYIHRDLNAPLQSISIKQFIVICLQARQTGRQTENPMDNQTNFARSISQGGDVTRDSNGVILARSSNERL